MNIAFPPATVDVAIMGGGIAGLTLALELHRKRPDVSVVVLERQAHPVPETIHKVGESTVEVAGHYLRDVLGLQSHLDTDQLRKFGLRVFFTNRDNSDITKRIELGHSICPPDGVGTYQLDRGRLENAMGVELNKLGVPFLTGCKVVNVGLDDGAAPHTVTVRAADGSEHAVHARWVVDATGRASVLKRQLGLQKKVGHRANAVWFRIAHPINIDDWSDDRDWHARIVEGRRELSTNHLMGPGYWVWLIRLATDAISVGIVSDPASHAIEELNTFENALAWLHDHEPQCAQAVESHRDQLSDFKVMTDFSYSCEQVFSEDRWCLAGEAGLFLDPLYSPGLDLIAVSNGLIVDLIGHELDGDDIAERAAIHNEMFLITANGWLGVYENQYPLMGNPRVMLAKVIWDTAVYWSVPGLLYFNDKFKDLADLPAVVINLARFSVASVQVQTFLREWAVLDAGTDVDTFVRFYDFDFLRRLHHGMTAPMKEGEFEQQFDANVRFIERLSGQLVGTIIEEFRNDSDDEAKQSQVARWLDNEVLSGFVSQWIAEPDAAQISDLWITLRRGPAPLTTAASPLRDSA